MLVRASALRWILIATCRVQIISLEDHIEDVSRFVSRHVRLPVVPGHRVRVEVVSDEDHVEDVDLAVIVSVALDIPPALLCFGRVAVGSHVHAAEIRRRFVRVIRLRIACINVWRIQVQGASALDVSTSWHNCPSFGQR